MGNEETPASVSLEDMIQSADARTLNMAGNAFADRGLWNEAIACYERSRALYQAANDRHGEALVLNNLGATSYAIGDWDAANACYQEALAALHGLHQPDTELFTLMNICFLHYAQGGKPGATLDRAQRLAEDMEQHDPLAKIHWMRGDAAIAAGDDLPQAFRFYAQACLHASKAEDDLLKRTLDYVEEHVRVLRERGQTLAALAFCDHLAQFGRDHALGDAFAARIQCTRSTLTTPPLLGGA